MKKKKRRKNKTKKTKKKRMKTWKKTNAYCKKRKRDRQRKDNKTTWRRKNGKRREETTKRKPPSNRPNNSSEISILYLRCQLSSSWPLKWVALLGTLCSTGVPWSILARVGQRAPGGKDPPTSSKFPRKITLPQKKTRGNPSSFALPSWFVNWVMRSTKTTRHTPQLRGHKSFKQPQMFWCHVLFALFVSPASTTPNTRARLFSLGLSWYWTARICFDAPALAAGATVLWWAWDFS